MIDRTDVDVCKVVRRPLGWMLVPALLVIGAIVLALSAESALAGSARSGTAKAQPAGFRPARPALDLLGLYVSTPASSQANIAKVGNDLSDPGRPGCEGWNQVASPSPSAILNRLYRVDAVSANDVWAAGGYVDEAGARHTLVEHWNGTTWSVVPSPNPGAGSYFYRIAAISHNDVWAAGLTCTTLDCANTGEYTNLFEHWNGTSWTVVPGADAGSGPTVITGLAAVKSNDVWAAGGDGLSYFFIEHWNGTTWSMVPIPNLNVYYPVLNNLYATKSRDVWAVGLACPDSNCNSFSGLVLHWDGNAWSAVSIPDAGGAASYLNDVSATSANDVWAVGAVCVDASCSQERGLVMHYNGRAWSIVPNPNPGSVDTNFQSVVAVSHNDVWVSGSYTNDGNAWYNPMLHWDGHNWKVYNIGSPGTVDNNIRGLAAVSRYDVWAVGDESSGAGYATQIHHYTNRCQ